MNRFEVRVPFVMWATLEVVAEDEDAAIKKAQNDILWPDGVGWGGVYSLTADRVMQGVSVHVMPADNPLEGIDVGPEVDDWGEE